MGVKLLAAVLLTIVIVVAVNAMLVAPAQRAAAKSNLKVINGGSS